MKKKHQLFAIFITKDILKIQGTLIYTRTHVVPHYKYCYIIHNINITLILYSDIIIAFEVVMLLHLTVSRKSRNNLELVAKNSVIF